MRRIATLFHSPGKKFVPFITPGFPDRDSTVDIVLAAERAGTHMVELGMPFSDPLADGPVIQHASQVAIRNGINLHRILEIVAEIRQSSEIPIVLMGYLNPILRFGTDNFLRQAQKAGVDGLILPDVPPEEGEGLYQNIKAYGMSPILLVAPNTNGDRMRKLGDLAEDLLYAVSMMGVTGSALENDNRLGAYLRTIRKHTETPFVVGFGISTPEDVQNIATLADGVVVGSALLKRIENSPDPAETTFAYLSELVAALPECEAAVSGKKP